MENKTIEMDSTENKTTDNILLDSAGLPLDLTGLPNDLTCNQEELRKWLDLDPPTDEEIEIMSKYFESEQLKLGKYVPLQNPIEKTEKETISLEMPEDSMEKAFKSNIHRNCSSHSIWAVFRSNRAYIVPFAHSLIQIIVNLINNYEKERKLWR